MKAKRDGDYTGWTEARRGRQPGGGLKVRKFLKEVLLFKLSVMAQKALFEHYDSAGDALVARAGLETLRGLYQHISPHSLKKVAWRTGESGSIGVRLQLGTCRSPHDPLKQMAVAVDITLMSDGKGMSKSSSPERCRGTDGCVFDKKARFAVREIRAAMEMTMGEVFQVLASAVQPSGMGQGTPVTYSTSLCVVRCTESSWPLNIVRNSRAGVWLCVSYMTGDV